MCVTMEAAFPCFSFLIIFSLNKQVFPSCNTGEKLNVAETLFQKEGSFLNITYLLNVSENSVSTEKSHFYVDVCQSNTRSLLCKFIRLEQSRNFTVKYGDVGDTLCVPERRYFTSSMMTWEMKISQLFTRSITAIYLYIESKTLHRQTVLIPIDVKYPSKVTNLTVDGQEVNSTHLIKEGEVNVCCFFKRGNPPVVFKLLDINGMEIADKVDKNTMQTKSGEEHLKVSLSVRCQDDWPTVRCEGSGSERNRSVSFLVRCAPRFIDGPVTLISSEFEKVTLHVKAHTTIFKECFLTPTPSQDTFIPKVKCNLSGEPPNLVLTLHPEENIYQGIWEITLGNEIGYDITTVNITEYSMSETTAQNEESVSETTARSDESVGVLTTIVLSCGCVLLVAVIAVVVVRIKIITKEPQKVTAGPTDERRQSNDTTEGATMIVNDMYGTTGGANIRHDVSQTFHPPNRDLSLPQTASRAPARPPRAQHVRARDDRNSAQSDSPYDHETYGQTYLTSADVCKNKKQQKKGGAEGVKGDIYASVSAVRKEEKNQAIKDRTTPVYEIDNTTETTESMEKASRQRDANGLIYGDLVFTAVSSAKPVVQQETKTEYATIAMTAIVPPRNPKK
ncbi:uncharacterized protein LOC112568126 isoform X2 [Pomacea canaliculata]|uniref:uncharacterized protein LOC112568126 isoform X2 n=1 Tax=Pomacea canaliculata TaxID=400727 RepID=UPI000D72CF4F|nr:uncharacterized protein LOC112568126 isoform X2 [Pomacea canaliculata]